MSLEAHRLELAAKLTAAGVVRVVTDPRNVSPPCALVGLPRRLERAGCGLAGELVVTLIGAGPGNADVVGPLLEQLELAAGAVFVITADPTSYRPDPGASAPAPDYPAYALVTRITS